MKALIVLLIVLWTGSVSAQELSVLEIIRKIDATERVASSKSRGKQIITTSGGKKRTLEMIAYSKNRNEKQIVIRDR